jgi:hypothetical protein
MKISVLNYYITHAKKCEDLFCHVSDIILPVHTDPNQFFLLVFCSCGQCSTQENTGQAAHQNGAAQTTCVATAANKYGTNKILPVCGKYLPVSAHLVR